MHFQYFTKSFIIYDICTKTPYFSVSVLSSKNTGKSVLGGTACQAILYPVWSMTLYVTTLTSLITTRMWFEFKDVADAKL